MARSFLKIAEDVMSNIPNEYKDKFKSTMSSLYFAAPEIQYLHFEKFQAVFNDVIPFPLTEDWHKSAVAALMNISVEEVDRRFGGRSK